MVRSTQPYPVDMVLAPEWWHSTTGISFDEDFFYHPSKRIEVEQQMEKILYNRWGNYGIGNNASEPRPELGAVHLAAGFLLSELLGCTVEYSAAHPPQVVPLGMDKLNIPVKSIFDHPRFQQFEKMADALYASFGYVTGDINWGGVLNIALDLRGENIFLDAMDNPDRVDIFFSSLAKAIEDFTGYIYRRTGTTSISVNRSIASVQSKIFLHSECTHTMISEEFYRTHLMRFDQRWSRSQRPFGIHYCGKDPHRFAGCYAELPALDFLDVGWGGDIAALRKALPGTFLNIRLDPVSLVHKSPAEIEIIVTELAAQAGDPCLCGFCCINIDDSMPEENITAIFHSAAKLRDQQMSML